MINIDDIKIAIETAFETPFKTILKGRHDTVMMPRHLFVALMLEEGYKTKQIADELGKKPSTISSSKNCTNNLLTSNRTFKDAYLVATKYLEDLD